MAPKKPPAAAPAANGRVRTNIPKRMATGPGSPFYVLVNGTLADVKTFYPRGCMHSLAATAAADMPPSESDPDPEPLHIHLYVGQNVFDVASEFAAAHGLPPESPAVAGLESSFFAALASRLDSRGTVLPWYATGGVSQRPVRLRRNASLAHRPAEDDPPAPGPKDAARMREECRERQRGVASAAAAAFAFAGSALLRRREREPSIFDSGDSASGVPQNVWIPFCLLRSSKPDGHAILRYLIDTFGPRLVNMPYQRTAPAQPPQSYEGEIALHVAIVHKDHRLVRFLVERGADVRARCYGPFFDPTGHCYYGEFPASFAVSFGAREIVRYLADHGAKLNEDRDSQGNTCLHMAVIHSRPQMFDFLVGEMRMPLYLLNARGHTPLTLAASMNNKAMFLHILYQSRIKIWRYGPVEAYNLPLRDVDTQQAASIDAVCQSAINVIVAEGHLDLLNEEVLLTLLQKKWDGYARGHFYFNTVVYLAFVVMLTLLGIHYRRPQGLFVSDTVQKSVLRAKQQTAGVCREHGETLYPLWLYNGTMVMMPGTGEENCDAASAYYAGSAYDTQTLGLEIITFALALTLLFVEVFDVSAWLSYRARVSLMMDQPHVRAPPPPPFVYLPGHKRRDVLTEVKSSAAQAQAKAWERIRWSQGTFWAYVAEMHPLSFLLWATIAIELLHFSLWASGYVIDGNTDLACASVMAWLYILYFLRSSQRMGHLVVIFLRILFNDVIRFIMLYLCFAAGFGQAAYLLIRSEWLSQTTGSVPQYFVSFGVSILRLFRHSIGDLSFEYFSENPYNDELTYTIILLWTIFGSVVLLNMLIAMMTSTFNLVIEDAERTWRLEWARIILLMERRVGARSMVDIMHNMLPHSALDALWYWAEDAWARAHPAAAPVAPADTDGEGLCDDEPVSPPADLSRPGSPASPRSPPGAPVAPAPPVAVHTVQEVDMTFGEESEVNEYRAQLLRQSGLGATAALLDSSPGARESRWTMLRRKASQHTLAPATGEIGADAASLHRLPPEIAIADRPCGSCPRGRQCDLEIVLPGLDAEADAGGAGGQGGFRAEARERVPSIAEV